MKEPKKLYRSRENKMVSGLCAGIGNYIGIDPTIVRVVATVAMIVFAGVPAGIYLILVMVVPLEPINKPETGGDVANSST